MVKNILKKNKVFIISSVVGVLVIFGIVFALIQTPAGKDLLETSLPGTSSASTDEQVVQSTEVESLFMGQDYLSDFTQATRQYEANTPGEIQYCELDQLERATCAYGLLTPSLRDAAAESGREDISHDPTGWRDNREVTIPALADVSGSTDYKGWFWNRSHLIADSLGGNAVAENLITGTRTQNVGSTNVEGQFFGGMAFPEVTARQWLDSQTDDSCPLYYAATPKYTGDNLIAHEVLVEMISCDDQLNLAVTVHNSANGWDINYLTGEYTESAK